MKYTDEDITQQIKECKEKSSKLVPTLTAVILDDGSQKQYAQFTQPQCSLCTSVFRQDAERLYLEVRKVDPVRKLLIEKDKEHGIAKPTWHWTTVDTHMKKHVDFTPVSIDYIRRIQQAKEEYAIIEREPINYGKIMCLDMMTELKSLDLSKNLDKLMEVNKTVNSILNTYKNFTSLEYEISGLREEAEKVVIDMANKFTEVMSKLMEKTKGIENKEIVRECIIEFQEFLKIKLDKMR